MQPNRRALFAFGIPVALIVAFLIASVIAWIYIGLPSAKFDPLKMPAFFWYYRHDPIVLKAFGAGMGIGLFLAAITIWWFAKLKPPLHGSARFARESEIRRAGFRAANGIVLGKKGGKFLTFGGSEHCIVEAPRRATNGAIPTMRLRGIERMTTSTSVSATSVVTARAPADRSSGSIVSGPRELATFTSWPASLNLVTSVLPM